MIQPDDLTEFISNIPLFESLSRQELETLPTYMERQFLKPGETLFNQWDRAESVYLIESKKRN